MSELTCYGVIAALYGTGVLLLLVCLYDYTTPKNYWKLYAMSFLWPLVTIGLLLKVAIEKALED